MSTIKTIYGDQVGQIITELKPVSNFPLLAGAERYSPKTKNEVINTIEFEDHDGRSAEATVEDGGITVNMIATERSVSWKFYRGTCPLTSTPTKGTGGEEFFRSLGTDRLASLIQNEVEVLGITAVQAAVTAGEITTEATHIVGGANTTFDAMTDPQIIAYINHLFQTLKLVGQPGLGLTLPNRLLVPAGKSARFQNLLNSVLIGTSGSQVQINLGVKMENETIQLLTDGIVEEPAVSWSGIVGAKTAANPLGTSAFLYCDKSGAQNMQYREWNQVLGPIAGKGHSQLQCLEMNCTHLPVRFRNAMYLTSAFA